MLSTIQITGTTITGGITIEPAQPVPVLRLSLDASTYSITATGPQQNVSGTSDNIGFFPYGWANPPSSGGFGNISPGWTVVGYPNEVVTAVDPINHVITVAGGGGFTSGTSYQFTPEYTWFDTVSNKPFMLYNGVSYDTGNGGSLVFDAASSQYAQCSTSLSDLNTWSVEAWHYYDGTNTGASPCIITEVYPGSTGFINYALGSLNDNNPALMAGWYSGAWDMDGYTLTSGNWYQIVGTNDGTTVKLYVNNVLVEQVASTGTAISSQGGINLMKRWDNAEFWSGNLGIVNIYEGALSQSSVTARWNANKARFGL